MFGKANIFLIGPMGSGKTAVGRHLARMLRYGFYDSDADIEAKTGVDIPFIFEKEGGIGIQDPGKGVDRTPHPPGVHCARHRRRRGD